MSSKKRIGFLAVVTSLIIVIGYLIANQSQSKSPQAVVSPIGSPTTSPEPKLRSISIVSSGDILLHERLWAQAKADGVDGADAGGHDAGARRLAQQARRGALAPEAVRTGA